LFTCLPKGRGWQLRTADFSRSSPHSAQESRYFSATPRLAVAGSRRNSQPYCRHCCPPGPTELSVTSTVHSSPVVSGGGVSGRRALFRSKAAPRVGSPTVTYRRKAFGQSGSGCTAAESLNRRVRKPPHDGYTN